MHRKPLQFHSVKRGSGNPQTLSPCPCFSSVRPRFTQPAKMRKRVIARPVGSSVRLKCAASGNPRPDIVWMKEERPLTDREVGQGRQKKWTLSLRNLTPEHSGRYTCRVSNRAGEINATYKVEVIRTYPAARLGLFCRGGGVRLNGCRRKEE